MRKDEADTSIEGGPGCELPGGNGPVPTMVKDRVRDAIGRGELARPINTTKGLSFTQLASAMRCRTYAPDMIATWVL